MSTLIPTPNFKSRFVPVIELADAANAVSLAKALLDGGVDVIEITLRTSAGLAAIKAIAQAKLPIHLGAGTVLTLEQLAQVQEAGASFALSPGATPALLKAAAQNNFSFIPGVATASEVMQAHDAGYQLVKFFPAIPAGGAPALAALGGPLSAMKFIPTGGIGADNYKPFLVLSNVRAIGGSWLAPKALIEAKQWSKITQLALSVENSH